MYVYVSICPFMVKLKRHLPQGSLSFLKVPPSLSRFPKVRTAYSLLKSFREAHKIFALLVLESVPYIENLIKDLFVSGSVRFLSPVIYCK